MTNFEIKQGDTWTGNIAVLKKDAITLVEAAFNCTGYKTVLIIKTSMNETVTDALRINGVWETITSGLGTVTITNAQCKLLSSKYAYELKLYNDAKTTQYTLAEGYITITPTVEKDIL